MKKIIAIVLMLISFTALADFEIIVPFSAGGAFDIVARKFEKFVTTEQSVVTNAAGAGGLIGIRRLESSGPNTVMITSSSFYANLNDRQIPLENFKPVSVLADAPLFLVVTKSSGLTCERLRDPSKYYFIGSAGKDSITSTPVVFILEKYKNFTEVPYKGVSQVMIDLLSNQVHASFIASLALARPELTILANTSAKPFQGIPTLNECLGINKVIQTQFLVIANSSADDNFVRRINVLANNFVKDPETLQYFTDQGMVVRASDVPTTNKVVQSELAHWGKLLK